MRQHETFKYLMDISISIERIEEFCADLPDFEHFSADLKTRLAIERLLEIIGEATNQLLKIKPETPISNARQIVDLRNRITHAYDDLDEVILWEVVTGYLPVLKTEVGELLA